MSEPAPNLAWIANYIWGIADDVLRDLYVRGKYRDVILPMTVLRRLDAVLEATKEDVMAQKRILDDRGIAHQDGPCGTGGMLTLVEDHNGSSLFTGDAGQGESNNRLWHQTIHGAGGIEASTLLSKTDASSRACHVIKKFPKKAHILPRR